VLTLQTGEHHHHRSCLKELDLSYNDFDEVPSGLPCVAPCLERLNLSHNQLTRFGPIDCYPASLRLLDLSHNRITALVDLCLEDSRGSASSTSTPIPTPSLLISTSQRCFSPFSLKGSVTTCVRCNNYFNYLCDAAFIYWSSNCYCLLQNDFYSPLA